MFKSKVVLCSVGILAGAVALFAQAQPIALAGTSPNGCSRRELSQLRVGPNQAGSQQRHVITTMLQIAGQRHASFRVKVSILSAAMQESKARELPYGDGSSLGPLQLISIHGPASLRIRSDFSANWYLPQAIRIDAPGITVAEIAVRVQRPAARAHYKMMINRHWKQSAMLDTRIWETCKQWS